MENHELHQAQAATRIHQVPDWETPTHPPKRSFFHRTTAGAPPAGSGTAPIAGPHKESVAVSGNQRWHSRFDALLPPHRRYIGLTRRVFLIALAAALALLILILGLGLGLGLRHGASSDPQRLPLPGNGADVYTGELTYYNLALGACGNTNSDTDLACAVAHDLFDAAAPAGANPNNNPLCGRKIRIVRDNVEAGTGNVSVDVTVVDRCVGCKPTDLDLSPAAFNQLAPESAGRVVGSWSWL